MRPFFLCRFCAHGFGTNSSDAVRGETCDYVQVSFYPSHRANFRWYRLLWLAPLIALLGMAWLAYRPGLGGDYLFDDFNNLPAIGATGPVHRLDTLARYLTSGTADPTGRPLTLASFLLDSREWPASPGPFLRTNILLHLLNGLLLFSLLVQLGREIRLTPSHAYAAALIGSGMWLLHPLMVSTTLYVVQREAMLPATFTMLGIMGWVSARRALQCGQSKRSTAGMIAAAGGCTLLATLAKGNGALLPMLILLVEWLILARAQPMPSPFLRRLLKRRVTILLLLPAALVLIWMTAGIPGYIHGTPLLRGWTLPQRLLTEPRALTDYLAMLFLLRQSSYGLFTDAFQVSIGWLQPATTLLCALFIATLIAFALVVRKRWPTVALAILFYFAGHLLESTWLPLELYYEHRNYQPAMLLFWPLGLFLGSPGNLMWLRRASGVAILGLLSLLTFERANLWSNGYQQAQVWAAFNPQSARAQAAAAQYQMARGLPHLAAARLTLALRAHPGDLQIPVNLVGAQCRFGSASPQAIDAVRKALATTRNSGALGFDWLNTALSLAADKSCPGLDLPTLQSFVDAGRRNPSWTTIPGWRQDMLHLQGLLDLANNNPQAALQSFNDAVAQTRAPDTALQQAAILGSRDLPALGLAHLNYWRTLAPPPPPGRGMPTLHAWILARQGYWEHEVSSMRATLASDAAAQARQRTPSSRD